MPRIAVTLPCVVCWPNRSLRPRVIVDRGVLAEGSPVLVRLIAQIASRFSVVVTQKLAAQTVPFIGALGGAAVNYASTFSRLREPISPCAGWNGAMAKMLSAWELSRLMLK